MISAGEFVQKSLELHLFFLRIMKEHSFFLEAGFIPKDQALARTAEAFKNKFNQLLKQAVELANGNVSEKILRSGEVVTDNTIAAEEKTEELSGIDIDIELTRRELRLRSGRGNPSLETKVEQLNAAAIRETRALIDFKTLLLNRKLECSLFTWHFPLLIEHLLEEAEFYVEHLAKLQERIAPDPRQEIVGEKVFWDDIMGEHAQFISHLLDPTEKTLIAQADTFARVFARLKQQAQRFQRSCRTGRRLQGLVAEEMRATRSLRNFKSTGEELILACQVRSIIIPLLADHVLREANHFLNILEQFTDR